MKVIFVEGPPGSGKTTYANKIKEQIEQSHKVKFCGEHLIEGIDISCQAYLSEKEFFDFINKFDAINGQTFKSKIIENAKLLNNKNYLVSYAYLFSTDYEIKNLLCYLYDKEISNRGVELEDYFQVTKDVWINYFTNSDILKYDYLIFEGSLIQTHLFNLKGYYNISDNECVNLVSKLLQLMGGSFNYEIHIICPKDYPNEKTIAQKDKLWEVGFTRWLDSAPCIKYKIGILDFCKQCNEVYLKILNDTSLNTIKVKREE